MRTRSLAVVGMLFGLGSVIALLPATLQAGEVTVDPAAPPAPAPVPRAGPVAPGPRFPSPVADPGPEPAPRLTREQLRELVGPVALYPDVVLASLLPASATPLDVVQASRWLAHRASPDEAPPTDRGWDPSVVALLQFPELVQWLDENLEWLEQLGVAMAVQPGDVLAAIQEFRELARASGALATNDFQRVVLRDVAPPSEAPAGTAPATIVYIEPVEPQVVYVPVYDPVVVIQPVTIVEPVIVWSACWTFSTWGPCAWHDLTWGWPCRTGWWGGGVFVYREPWHCGRPRTTHYVSDLYGPSRWQPSQASQAYAPRRATSTVVSPRRPAWDAGLVQGGTRDGTVARRTAGGSLVQPTSPDGGADLRHGPTATWRRRGLDLPADVLSAARSATSGRRRASDAIASGPRVAPSLPSIPPAMEGLPPSLPGVNRRTTLGTARSIPSLGDADRAGDATQRARDAIRRYAPRTRAPVTVQPSAPTGQVLRDATADQPPAAVVLPPTATTDAPRQGRSSWRRSSNPEEATFPRVLPTPRNLPAPSRAVDVVPRVIQGPAGGDADAPARMPATRGDARSSQRSSRGPMPRVESSPSTDAPRSARVSGAVDRVLRRFGSGGDDAPPAPRRR